MCYLCKTNDFLMKKVRGAGDIVYFITKYTGIKLIVKKMFGNDCGCDERREKLNVKLPM